MEINKQVFENVLAGKLKGTFVLRNKLRIKTKFLRKSNFKSLGFLYKLHDVDAICAEYTEYGKASNCAGSDFDIIDFIPDTIEIDPEMYSYNEKDMQFVEHFIDSYHMKENELTIVIPDGKTVDWDESKKQNKIILKDKPLTYKDICEKLFKDDHYAIAWEGYPIKCCSAIYNASNATAEHQLECILAKNKLANVAVYLNDGWKPDKTNLGHFDAWVLYTTSDNEYIGYVKISNCAYNSNALFKSEELAQQAIEILGKETVKLALEPLGI